MRVRTVSRRWSINRLKASLYFCCQQQQSSKAAPEIISGSTRSDGGSAEATREATAEKTVWVPLLFLVQFCGKLEVKSSDQHVTKSRCPSPFGLLAAQAKRTWGFCNTVHKNLLDVTQKQQGTRTFKKMGCNIPPSHQKTSVKVGPRINVQHHRWALNHCPVPS